MALAPEDLLRGAMPPGYERDELLRLVRLGKRFADQHCGRKPGVLRRHVESVVADLPERTFEALLVALEFDALLGNRYGTTPILRVDRTEESLRYLENGVEREASFKRIRNIARLRVSREPVTREIAE